MTKRPMLSWIVVDGIVSQKSPTQIRRHFFELIPDNNGQNVSFPEKQSHGPICEKLWLRYGVVIGKDSPIYPEIKRQREEVSGYPVYHL